MQVSKGLRPRKGHLAFDPLPRACRLFRDSQKKKKIFEHEKLKDWLKKIFLTAESKYV